MCYLFFYSLLFFANDLAMVKGGKMYLYTCNLVFVCFGIHVVIT